MCVPVACGSVTERACDEELRTFRGQPFCTSFLCKLRSPFVDPSGSIPLKRTQYSKSQADEQESNNEMSTIIMTGVPSVIEVAKDADPAFHVGGGHIVVGEIARALLKHGRAERYYFTCDAPHALDAARRTLAQYPNGERGQVVPIDMLAEMTSGRRGVMQTNNIFMFGLAYQRRAMGRCRWPVLGLTHTLSAQDYPAFALIALATLFEDLRSYDCLICTSKAGRAAFQKVYESVANSLQERFGVTVPYKSRYAVIPLGIDIGSFGQVERLAARRELGVPKDDVVFLYFGRFASHLKMDLFPLVLTFAQVVRGCRSRNQKPPLLMLAGDDCEMNLTPHLEKFAAELGITDCVSVRPNPARAVKRDCYAAADVFISPCDNVQETFGLTIIEAMAAGLPVIASDWDGYRESVEHGVTGLLVPTYWNTGMDYISKLAIVRSDSATHWMLGQCVTVDPACLRNSIESLMNAPELRRAMGEEGRKRAVERFDWPVIIGQYEQLWEELMDAASADTAEEKPFQYGNTTYDYINAFGHYATRLVPPEARVKVTPLGHNYAEGKERLLPLDVDTGLFRSDAIRHIAKTADSNGVCSWGALADRTAGELKMPIELVRHHVARLMKYGLLEIV
jgi:D-inositol-3-phosphate glycosyltransferase